KTHRITDDITWIGALDPNLRIFDIIMYTEFGTTYNSYVLKGSEKTAVIDTAKHKFLKSYIEKLTSITPIDEIDIVIVHHVEPDHSGSLQYLIEKNPNIKVYGSPPAIKYLNDILNIPFNGIMIKESDTLSLGNKTLRFFMAPNLHWPDAMYTYIEEDKVLFSCDSFGSHYSFDEVLLSKINNKDDHKKAIKTYFDDIMAPFKPFVLRAMSKLDGLDIQMILTGHGPCLDENIPEAIALYRQWAQEDTHNTKITIVIPYVSAYGYTEKMAFAIKEGIEVTGDFDVRLFDMVKEDNQKVVNEILHAEGFLLGTPTILNEALKPIWDIVGYLNPVIVKDKHASAFGSYGWSGEGVPHIIERLKQLRIKVMEGLAIKFNPDQEKLKLCHQFGVDFANQILSAKK
ncbi:MAG: FprA family A-type flavoprotein, partial [Erysipelothrix sp.]|nr:FprA family A-type flavoprotein [Erysipelothrix sp.]